MTQPSSDIHLLYATRDGQTRRIVERLASRWQKGHVAYALHDLSEQRVDPHGWPLPATVVVIAPIRFGFHLPPIERFLRAYKKILENQRLVMVSINLTARKPEKNTPETNPYYKKWVKKHKFSPVLGAVLAGKLNYSLYKTWEKWVIRFIMFLTGGPTHFDAIVDYTPWDRVDDLANQIASLSSAKEAA